MLAVDFLQQGRIVSAWCSYDSVYISGYESVYVGLLVRFAFLGVYDYGCIAMRVRFGNDHTCHFRKVRIGHRWHQDAYCIGSVCAQVLRKDIRGVVAAFCLLQNDVPGLCTYPVFL